MFFDIIATLSLVLCLAAGWVLTLLNLPGNWLMVAAAAAYAHFAPNDARFHLSWKLVAWLAAIALVGEAIEFAAGALGATQAGASRRGAIMAMLGSLLGGLVGAVVGLPVPIVGPVLAAVLFAAAGALAGAVLGELSAQRSRGELWRIGWGAFWGRILGTIGKVLAGSVIAVVVIVGLFV